MKVIDYLENAKKALRNLLREAEFSKNNKEREKRIDSLYLQSKCRGQLESMLSSLDQNIRTDQKNIQKGIAGNYDTFASENDLKETAIAYLLIKDAIFVLDTAGNYNGISQAMDTLNLALKKMSGKKLWLQSSLKVKKPPKKDYGYLNTEDAVKQKEDLVTSVFSELKATGDIETCLSHARYMQKVESIKSIDSLGRTDAASTVTPKTPSRFDAEPEGGAAVPTEEQDLEDLV